MWTLQAPRPMRDATRCALTTPQGRRGSWTWSGSTQADGPIRPPPTRSPEGGRRGARSSHGPVRTSIAPRGRTRNSAPLDDRRLSAQEKATEVTSHDHPERDEEPREEQVLLIHENPSGRHEDMARNRSDVTTFDPEEIPRLEAPVAWHPNRSGKRLGGLPRAGCQRRRGCLVQNRDRRGLLH